MSKTKHFKRKYDSSEERFDDPRSKREKIDDGIRKDKKIRNALRSNNISEILHLEDLENDDVGDYYV